MSVQPPAPYDSRPVRLDDAEAVAGLMNANAMEQVGEPYTNADELRTMWTAPSFDLAGTSVAVTTPEGELAAMVLVDARPPFVEAFAFGEVAPAHRGRALGSYLLSRADGLAWRALAEAPAGSAAVLHWGAWHGEEGLFALLRAHAFAPVRYFCQMRVELAEPPQPPEPGEGIELRPFRDGDARVVYDTLIEAFRDHWGEREETFEHFVHDKITDAGSRFDPGLWFLAVAGDEVVGAAVCQPESASDPTAGYVRELGVRPAWRRRGIARALLLRSFEAFRERGAAAVTLHVDAASPTGALALYEQAGMTASPSFEVWERPLAPDPAGVSRPAPSGDLRTMDTDAETRRADDDWDPPEGDDVTEPEDLAEADPDLRQSPLRVEEQPGADA